MEVLKKSEREEDRDRIKIIPESVVCRTKEKEKRKDKREKKLYL